MKKEISFLKESCSFMNYDGVIKEKGGKKKYEKMEKMVGSNAWRVYG